MLSGSLCLLVRTIIESTWDLSSSNRVGTYLLGSREALFGLKVDESSNRAKVVVLLHTRSTHVNKDFKGGKDDDGVSHCLKITQNVAFEFMTFWHFPPIFVLLKLTCLVTLFDSKLQVFKNSPKWTIFWHF